MELPLDWEDFSNIDVCAITSHFLVLIFFYCGSAYLCYSAFAPEPTLWTYFCILLTLALMLDLGEMDARTGVPLEEQNRARQYIQDAVMDNKSFKETMIILFQYARPVPRNKTYVVFPYKLLFGNVNTWLFNVILVLHFLVITDDDFMIVF